IRLSDGIFDTKRITKRAFDGKGEPKIPNYTWHHHQDTGRMQLVPEEKHSPTGHIGGRAMDKGK
ncbi:TPA: HNH endonuclease, partial [Neisseria meningitidis]